MIIENIDVKEDGSYSRIHPDGSAITGRVSFLFEPRRKGSNTSGTYTDADGLSVTYDTWGFTVENPHGNLMAFESRGDSGDERIEVGGDKDAHVRRGQYLHREARKDRNNMIPSFLGGLRLYANRPGDAGATAAKTLCTGISCRVKIGEGENLVRAVFHSPHHYGPSHDNHDNILMVMTKDGIALALDEEPHKIWGYTPYRRSFGAWMDHAGFFVTTGGTLGSGNDKKSVRMVSAVGRQPVDSFSGSYVNTASKPAADATWRGSMVGTVTQGEARDHLLRGDAELTFNLNKSTISAQFFNIKDFDRLGVPHLMETWVNGRKKQNNRISFKGIPVAEDGSYERTSNLDGGNIRGAFYGSYRYGEHAETAGTFDRYGIIAAFGAKRVPPAIEPDEDKPDEDKNARTDEYPFMVRSGANLLGALMARLSHKYYSDEHIEIGGDKDAHRERGANISGRWAKFLSADLRLYADNLRSSGVSAARVSGCKGMRCRARIGGTGRAAEILDAGDYVPAADSGDDVRVLMTHRDISLVVDNTQGNAIDSPVSFGAWMDDAGFFVATGGTVGSGANERAARMVVVAGERTGNRPAADASWYGSMVGTVRQGKAKDHILRGEAQLTFNMERSRLDAYFFNIRNFHKHGARHTALGKRNVIGFTAIPVAADGSYEKTIKDAGRGYEPGNIRGAFYGKGHAETAGTFERFNVIAAFGAKKVRN